MLLSFLQAVSFSPWHAGSEPSPGPVPILLPPQLFWELGKPDLGAVLGLCWLQAFGPT